MVKFYVILLLVLCRFNIEGHAQSNYQECDKYGNLFYEELGCQANFKNDKSATSCPHSYTCPEYVIPKGKCFYKGQIYNEGEGFEHHHCYIGCKCRATLDGKMEFVCAVVDCFFGPLKPGCFRIRDIQECCPSEEVCYERNVTCKVDGQIYRQEEYFQPKDSCMSCVCKQDFVENHYEEPHCERICYSLEFEFRPELEKQCSPFYKESYNSKVLCCPSDFVCPENIIKFEKLSRNVTSGQGREQCKFDSKFYNVGEAFQVEFKSVEWVDPEFGIPKDPLNAICECALPPYFTCTNLN